MILIHTKVWKEAMNSDKIVRRNSKHIKFTSHFLNLNRIYNSFRDQNSKRYQKSFLHKNSSTWKRPNKLLCQKQSSIRCTMIRSFPRLKSFHFDYQNKNCISHVQIMLTSQKISLSLSILSHSWEMLNRINGRAKKKNFLFPLSIFPNSIIKKRMKKKYFQYPAWSEKIHFKLFYGWLKASFHESEQRKAFLTWKYIIIEFNDIMLPMLYI